VSLFSLSHTCASFMHTFLFFPSITSSHVPSYSCHG
jgi:hypothetical protein